MTEPASTPIAVAPPWARRLVAGPFNPYKLSQVDALVIFLIVGWGLWLLAPGLAHPGLQSWDGVFHQAAARGTYDSFFFPHIYSDPLWPVPVDFWWSANVWLHKPTAPFWFAALVMKVIGVTPFALRLGALLGQLGAAVCLYLLARNPAGRLPAALGSMGFLALPFGWRLTQGLLFGDATDCTLVGFVTLSIVLLVWTIEKDSWRWALATGAAIGVGYLCKTVMALAPLGVATVLTFARLIKFSKGPRLSQYFAIAGGAFAFGAPWNIYCALKWPDVYGFGAKLTIGHLFSSSGAATGSWHRPLDAVFNELNSFEYAPLPVTVPLMAAAWLLIRGVWKREPAVMAVALWVWATWCTHSMVSVKAPAHVWNAVPAVFIGLALILADARRYPPLAAAALTAIFTPKIIGWIPSLGVVRGWLPQALEQTRTKPGLAEGIILCSAAALITWGIWKLAKRPRPLGFVLAGAYGACLLWIVAWLLPSESKAQWPGHETLMLTSYSREPGLAIDAVIPKKSVLFQDFELDPPEVFEIQGSIFYSGRMTYRQAPDLAVCAEKGYHPYLVSPAAEPYAPVREVPGHAWLRVYDLLAPVAGPTPLPDGIQTVALELGDNTVLGLGHGPIDSDHDKYAFYVRPIGAAAGLSVVFVHEDGTETPARIEPEASLRNRGRLTGAQWYVLPAIGPAARRLKAIDFGPSRQRVTLGPLQATN